jgi:hypothetical protein
MVIEKKIILSDERDNFGIKISVSVDGEERVINAGMVSEETVAKLQTGLVNTILINQLLKQYGEREKYIAAE